MNNQINQTTKNLAKIKFNNIINKQDYQRFIEYHHEDITFSYEYVLHKFKIDFEDWCLFCYNNSSEGQTKNYPKKLVNKHLYEGFQVIEDQDQISDPCT